jgi:uncharacterized membrane protein SpoIIM required for sporulation
MAELQLKSYRFRQEREADWLRLEALLARVERGSVTSLSEDDLVAVPILYRQALSSLSVARAISLDRALLEYLESLSARAYFLVYGARESVWRRIARFFVVDWPAAVRALWRETLVAGAIMLLGVLLGYLLCTASADWFAAFVPQGLAQGRDPSASTEALRHTLYSHQTEGLSGFAAQLFTHNAGVSLFAFALGFAFGVPTALLSLQNGCTLGAFLALFGAKGLGWEAGGWMMIHGVTELYAVTLACAAGFRIGWATAFPGALSRVDAAAVAGRKAATVMGGVLVMLIVAGLLEGIGRQLIEDMAARYAIALGTGILWLGYFYTPRHVRPVPAEAPHD